MRYTHVWDVETVLNLLQKWSPARKLSLEILTKKLVCLILFVTGQRPQLITALYVWDMELSPSKVQFCVPIDKFKQGRLEYTSDIIQLKAYLIDRRLCVHTYMYITHYLKWTLNLRGKVKSLLITTRKPYITPTVNSVLRWFKDVLGTAGIDIFSVHAGEFAPCFCQ